MKVHLVDGTYELFRHHFGAPPRKDPEGREVGATVGLLRSLSLLVSTPGVTHVACAFDHVIESFRNGLFSGYKTGAGVDPALLAQFSLAERAVSALRTANEVLHVAAQNLIEFWVVATRPEGENGLGCRLRRQAGS